MATKKVKYNKTGIAELPNDKSVLYRIETKSGGLNYIGVIARGKVVDHIMGHLGEIPGATLRIEQFDSIKDARKKQANVIKRSGEPKYNA